MADVLSLEQARKKRRKLRRILWLSFLGLVVLGLLLIYFNRDSLRNFDAEALMDPGGSSGFPLTLPSSEKYETVCAGTKLLMLTDTYLNIYNGSGSLLTSIQHGMNNPCLAFSGTRCALYVRGTQSYLLVTLNTLKYAKYDTESSIALISCDDSGRICVVESGSRYVSEMIVYDASHQEIYRWQTQQLLTSVAFSSPELLAAVSLSASEGALVSTVNLIPLYQEDFLATLSFPENMLLSLDCKSNGNILAVGDNAAVCISPQGELLSTIDYSSESLSYFDNTADTVLLVLGDYVAYKSDEVVVTDSSLTELGRFPSTNVPVSLATNNQQAAVLFEDTVLLWKDSDFVSANCGYGYLGCELFNGQLLLRSSSQMLLWNE